MSDATKDDAPDEFVIDLDAVVDYIDFVDCE